MKPIKSLAGSILVTAAIALGLGYLASRTPVSMAAVTEDDNSALDSEGTTEPAAGGLLIEITDVRNSNGNVIVLVFDNAKAFTSYDHERAAAYAEIAAVQGTLTVHFPELVTGPYAVTFFHDENEDYDLNMDDMYPLEGYGTSGAKDSYDEPTFDEASVKAGGISVRMYYL